MAAATKAAATALKVACLRGRETDVDRMGLGHFLVDAEALDEQAVGDVVGKQAQVDGFTRFDGDFRGLEGKPLRVYLNGAGRLVSLDARGSEQAKGKEREQDRRFSHDRFSLFQTKG